MRRPVRLPTPRPALPQVAQVEDRRPDEVVVLLDQTQPGNVESAIAQQYRLVRLQGEDNELLQVRVQRYRIPDQRTPGQVVSAMQGDVRVSLVQPNFLYRLQADRRRKNRRRRAQKTNTSMKALQYATAALKLNMAHKIATGRDAMVAVIDSGVDKSHPELSSAVADTFNAVGGRTAKVDAHGTAVAGIIGARAKLLGVAPGVRLLAARAFFREGRKGPLTTTFILLRAFNWSYAKKARVFNLSFAGPEDTAVHRTVTALHKRGAILIGAAGNGGPKATAAYPAAYPEVIAITAHDKSSRLYTKANRGDYVEVAAPGVDVLVPVPRGGYDVKSGTSFAAAHISGLVALMLEREPGLTTDQVQSYISVTAHDLGPQGHDRLFGAGRADALGAMKALVDESGPMQAERKPPIAQTAGKR